MSFDYKLTYYSPNGSRVIESLIFSSFSYLRKEDDVGQLTVLLPPVYDPGLFQHDGRLEVYSSVDGGPFVLEGETSFLVNRARLSHSAEGLQEIEITADDMLVLLKRRVVAYDPGSSYTIKEGLADDLMKAVIVENYGASCLDTARNIAAFLAVEADTGAGAIISDEISWKNVLDVIKGFADASNAAGVRILFDIVKTTDNLYTFRTYKNYRGMDHSSTSARPVILSLELGNLSEPEVVVDWSEEANAVYVSGKGEDDVIPLGTATDPARLSASPYARAEVSISESNTADPAALSSIAGAALQGSRPKILFNGAALDTPSCRYRVDYNYGDLVTATYMGLSFNCRVDALKIDVSQTQIQREIRLAGEAYA